jgi:hypothetical protein
MYKQLKAGDRNRTRCWHCRDNSWARFFNGWRKARLQVNVQTLFHAALQCGSPTAAAGECERRRRTRALTRRIQWQISRMKKRVRQAETSEPRWRGIFGNVAKAKERRRRTFPQNLSIRIRQVSAPERVLRASCAPFGSGRKVRLTSRPAFPGGRSSSLRLPSSFPRPSRRCRRSQRVRNAL